MEKCPSGRTCNMVRCNGPGTIIVLYTTDPAVSRPSEMTQLTRGNVCMVGRTTGKERESLLEAKAREILDEEMIQEARSCGAVALVLNLQPASPRDAFSPLAWVQVIA